jgi:hypothetical protein
MPHRLTYDFRREAECSFEHAAESLLAIVDLDSYPAFAGRKLDRLDLLQHLCLQMQSLTAMMWETPEATLRLRVLFAPDYHAVEDLSRTGHHIYADGWVRTTIGRLCLAGHARLFSSARKHRHGLLWARRSADAHSPRTFLVPPGIYAVTVFGAAPGKESEPDYTVVLRHYPPPSPRLQPVRLHSMFLEEMAEKAGVITSHSKAFFPAT